MALIGNAFEGYVDSQISGGGSSITLSNVSDGDINDGAYKFFDPNQSIVDAIDDLNEVIENIRNVLSSHEQISLLKAYYSVADRMEEWNNVMPPLKKIDNPSNNKQVTALLDLVGQIDTLVPSSSWYEKVFCS